MLSGESDCIVTNAWDKPLVSGPRNQVLVALNCNSALASPDSPGNSLASPEGRQASAAHEDAG